MSKNTVMKHTLDLIKMDLRRTLRTQPFYWLLLGVVTMVMVVYMAGVSETSTLVNLLGSITHGEYDPMASMMGISIVPLFSMIYLVLNIGGEFATGFVKNIFTFHANKWEYILSKIFIGTFVSTVYMLVYLMGFFIVGNVMGIPFGDIGVVSVVLFVVQKMMLTIPLSAIVFYITVYTRNRAWGIVAACIISMGAITMCMTMIGSTLQIPLLEVIATWFVSGCTNQLILTQSLGQFIKVISVIIIWAGVCGCMAKLTLTNKDIL